VDGSDVAGPGGGRPDARCGCEAGARIPND
jgi:hypothetical protein